MNIMSLASLIYQDINENYGYGNYNNFKIIIMKRNSYVNATKLCEQVKKNLDDWLENEYNKKLIKCVKEKITEYDEELVPLIIVNGKKNSATAITYGTYVHPLLIVHIASWASVNFASIVSNVVNNRIGQKYKMKDEELVTSNNIKIKPKKLSNDSDESDDLSDYSVPKTRLKNEYLAIIKITNNTYHIIKRQQCLMKDAIKNYMIGNKESKLIYISWNPDTVNNFNKIKEYINKVIINENTLKLKKISENELMRILYKINNDKYDQNKKKQLNDHIKKMMDDLNLDEDDEDDEDEDEDENEDEKKYENYNYKDYEDEDEDDE